MAIQIYNWNIADKNCTLRAEFLDHPIAQALDKNVMIAYGIHQETKIKYNLLFNIYQITVIESDYIDYIENPDVIVYQEEYQAAIAKYGSESKSFTRIYSIEKLNHNIETYFSGQNQYDSFFNIIKINPSSIFSLEIIEKYFTPYMIDISLHNINHTEYNIFIPLLDISKLREAVITPSPIPIPLEVLAFDMEVFSTGGFPKANNPLHAIISISASVNKVMSFEKYKAIISLLDINKTSQSKTSQNQVEGHNVITKDDNVITKDHNVITKDDNVITKDHNVITKNKSFRLSQNEIKELYNHHNHQHAFSFNYYPKTESNIDVTFEIIDGILYLHYRTEDLLITNFIKFIQTLNPQHITGHNCIDFDFSYLLNRIKFMGMNRIKVPKLEFAKSLLYNHQPIKFKSINSKGRTMIIPEDTSNILIIDFYNYMKKYQQRMDSFALNHLSKTLLKWKSKRIGEKIINQKKYYLYSLSPKQHLQIPSTKYICCNDEVIECLFTREGLLLDSLNELLEDTLTLSHCKAEYDLMEEFLDYTELSHQLCAEYCVHDSMLSLSLYLNDDVQNSIVALSEYGWTSQSHSTVYENNKAISSVLLQQLTNMNLVLPKDLKSDHTKKYKAAYVKEPEKNIINNPLLTFDITSEYPNCIIFANLSYETVIETITVNSNYDALLIAHKLELKYKNQNVIIITSTTSKDEPIPEFYVSVFDRNKIGVIPSFLQNLLDERARRKNLIKIYNKKINSTNDPIEQSKLEMEIAYESKLEMAIKLLVNSTYGFIGSSLFKLSMTELARSCTALGVSLIKYVISLMESKIILHCSNDQNSIKLIDYSITFNKPIVKPWKYGVIKANTYTKSLTLKSDNEFLLEYDTLPAYTDTDSGFQEYILKKIHSSKQYDFNISTPSHPALLKILFEYGNRFATLMNDELLLNSFQIKFEKIMTYTNIIKKRYTAYVYNSLEDIDKVPKLFNSGGTLVQRNVTKYHKAIINKLELLSRELSSKPIEEARRLFKADLSDIYTNAINNINNLKPSDFVRSRCFRETKRDDNPMTLLVKKHNELIELGDHKNYTYINLGDRYYTLRLVPKTTKLNEVKDISITKSENIMPTNINDINLDDQRIYFESYWKLIDNDIKRRFNHWLI